jgi:hypothetical protein
VQSLGTQAAPLGASSYDPANNATLSDVLVANKSAESTLHLLARITFQTGSVFEFYEPTPGHIVFSEAGIAGAPSHQNVGAGERPVARFQVLSPGTTAPQSLVEAQQRTDDLIAAAGGATTPASPQVRVGAGPAGVERATTVSSADEIGCGPPPGNNGSCDPSWFKSHLCTDNNVGDIGYDDVGIWPWCIYNWWTSRWENSGSNYSVGYGASCASIGSHLLTVSAPSGGGGQWTVSQGTYRWVETARNCGYIWPQDYCRDQTMQYSISNGGEFNHCGLFADYD